MPAARRQLSPEIKTDFANFHCDFEKFIRSINVHVYICVLYYIRDGVQSEKGVDVIIGRMHFNEALHESTKRAIMDVLKDNGR